MKQKAIFIVFEGLSFDKKKAETSFNCKNLDIYEIQKMKIERNLFITHKLLFLKTLNISLKLLIKYLMSLK